jgi:thymidylate synthase ThyX
MQTIVLGSTQTGHNMPIDEALKLSSYAAGVCYMKEDVESILNEDIEKTQRRIDMTLSSGHHSVYQHQHYTLVFQDIPKIIAMIINNEKPYTTSEKSARYTKMTKLPIEEKERYDKWLAKFKEMIKAEYPLLLDAHINKLAMENARYMISVFTPTTMVYTTNLCQLNYLTEMLLKFVQDAEHEMSLSSTGNPFLEKLRKQILLFVESLKPFEVEGMSRKNKNMNLSLFSFESQYGLVRSPYYGDVYDTYYYASFAQLAQAQRHRTINYTSFIPDVTITDREKIYYVPPMIQWTKTQHEWHDDLLSLSPDTFPQARMVLVHERGMYEHFILKCHERLCCQAQNEIMDQTKQIFTEYLLMAPKHHKIHQDFPNINAQTFNSKVQLKNIWCAGSCNNFGRRYALNRKA